jgi:hypothetical protein
VRRQQQRAAGRKREQGEGEPPRPAKGIAESESPAPVARHLDHPRSESDRAARRNDAGILDRLAHAESGRPHDRRGHGEKRNSEREDKFRKNKRPRHRPISDVDVEHGLVIFHDPTADRGSDWKGERHGEQDQRSNEREVLPGKLGRARAERFHDADLPDFAFHPERNHAGRQRGTADKGDASQDFEDAQHRGHERGVRMRVAQGVGTESRVLRLQPSAQIVGEFSDVAHAPARLESHEKLIELCVLPEQRRGIWCDVTVDDPVLRARSDGSIVNESADRNRDHAARRGADAHLFTDASLEQRPARLLDQDSAISRRPRARVLVNEIHFLVRKIPQDREPHRKPFAGFSRYAGECRHPRINRRNTGPATNQVQGLVVDFVEPKDDVRPVRALVTFLNLSRQNRARIQRRDHASDPENKNEPDENDLEAVRPEISGYFSPLRVHPRAE